MASIVQALADCLEAMRRGDDLEAILTRYPGYRAQLRALLEVAALIRPLPEDVAPSPVFREATRARLLEASAADQWHLASEGHWHDY